MTYVLVDIGMPMLTRRELANAQGFPVDYILDSIRPNSKANVWLSVFGSMMRHAIRIDNPAAEVPILKTGEHEPWPADLLRVCLEKATPMTRLAIVTGLCSGQRIGDVARMQYGWLKDGITQSTQQKVCRGGVTKDVAVPMHPFWKEELIKLPRKSVTLLYERTGVPFRTTGAFQERLRALMEKNAVKEVPADLVARDTIAEGRGGYLIADVQDPILDENGNPYRQVATRKARIGVRAKSGYRGELLVKLYVMDFIEASDEAAWQHGAKR